MAHTIPAMSVATEELVDNGGSSANAEKDVMTDGLAGSAGMDNGGEYISKKQKIGQFELKKSVSTLPLLQEKLEARGLKTASAQLAHVVNRMFTTLESKGILRVATEEFLLSSRYKAHDHLTAKFIRTFRSENFPRKVFIQRCKALCKGGAIDERVLLPKMRLGKV